jgi:hypothetical protein
LIALLKALQNHFLLARMIPSTSIVALGSSHCLNNNITNSIINNSLPKRPRACCYHPDTFGTSQFMPRTTQTSLASRTYMTMTPNLARVTQNDNNKGNDHDDTWHMGPRAHALLPCHTHHSMKPTSLPVSILSKNDDNDDSITLRNYSIPVLDHSTDNPVFLSPALHS